MKTKIKQQKKIYWFDVIVLSFFFLSYTLVFSYFTITRHNAFASGYDLGNFDHTIWNTLFGKFYSLTIGPNFVSRFAVHADPILILISPIFLVWNNVRILLIFQSLFVGLTVFPLYFLGKAIIKNRFVSIVLAGMFLLVPSVQWSNIYDFHPPTIGMFFLIAAFYFAWTKQWRWFVIFAVLKILCKESSSLAIAALGVLLVYMKEYKIGFATIVASLFWFVLTITVVMPYFSIDHKYWLLSWVDFLNEAEASGRAVGGLTPGSFLKYFVAPDAGSYYIQLLKPYFFIPLLGAPWIILAIPTLLINLISTQGQMRSIYFHYDSNIQAGLIIATIFAFGYIKILLVKMKVAGKLASSILCGASLCVLAVCLRVNYHYGPLPTTPSCWCLSYKVTGEEREFEKLLRAFPQSASITSSPEIRPHVTHRVYAYTLPAAVNSADYIALIDQNRLVGNYEPKTFELELRDKLNATNTHTLIKHIGHFYLYKKN